MKELFGYALTSFSIMFLGFVFVPNANAQLLISEIEADPGNQANDSCQFFEVSGTPGSTVPANTWVVAVDSDSANPGVLSLAQNIGGQSLGSNGILVVVNTFGGLCPNRTFSASTTVFTYNSPIRIGGGNIHVGSESFILLETEAVLFAGQDADIDDNGNLDFSSTALDAVCFLINPDEQYPYPSNCPVVGTAFQDVPDAVVRFPGNNTAFSGAAFYWGEIAPKPDESVEFVAPLSPNFPAGGVLSPGATNAPAAANVSISGRVTANGRPVAGAIVILSANGVDRISRTSMFGYYSFFEVPTGSTYTATVSAKRYTFTPQVITPSGNISDLDFEGVIAF